MPWSKSRPGALTRSLGRRMERGGAPGPFHASMQPQRPELESVLDAWHGALHRPQRTQRRLLRLGQALRPADIEALVGPVAPQRPQMLAAVEIPDVDGSVIAATGEPLAIGTHSE